MADVLNRGTNMPAAVVAEMFNAVKGKSALARISDAKPLAFNGNTVFTFNFANEANFVAESDVKPDGGITATPVTIQPIKMEYGARVSDEFIYGSEEEGMDIIREFAEGAAKSFARALDLGAMHRVNPRTGTASTLIPTTNAFDTAIANANKFGTGDGMADFVSAISAVDEVNGLAIAPTLAGVLGSPANGVIAAPEYSFGGDPDTFRGHRSAVASTVSYGATPAALAYVGDFENAFRWGYARDVEVEVIRYGNPDNSNAGDLKYRNQVYLRAEAYIGWGILDPSAFAMVTPE